MDHTTRSQSFPRKHELTRQGVCVCVSLSFVFKAEDAPSRSLSEYGGVPGRPGTGSDALPPAVGTSGCCCLLGPKREGLEMRGGILASHNDCKACWHLPPGGQRQLNILPSLGQPAQ